VRIVYLQPNHLIGLKQHYLRLSFLTITDLLKVRREVKPAVKKNHEQLKHNNFYTEMLTTALASKGDSGTTRKTADQMENIIDIRYLRKHCVLTLSVLALQICRVASNGCHTNVPYL
jgi:hypothetical protein